MSAVAVREQTQEYKLESQLTMATNASMAAGNQPGPEVTEVEVQVQDLIVYGFEGNTMVAWCDTHGLKVVKGSLPAVIQPVVLGRDVTWPEDKLIQYSTARVKLSTNGVTEVVAIEPVAEPA